MMEICGDFDGGKFYWFVYVKNGVCWYCKIMGNCFGCGVVRIFYYKCEVCEVNFCC